ncbi:hypothetical protein DWW36_07720 [Erysipelotrichaceae bacterium AF15-26LB]|nr:hypothetical protein DWW36_07720 [Erysipelotrichaceae bacterium AF15-26LB]RJV90652.1 hypothetical protein DWX45_07910 [Erysipelotrichaceae bacterium AF19-24AC]
MEKGNVKRFLWQLSEKTRQENRILKNEKETDVVISGRYCFMGAFFYTEREVRMDMENKLFFLRHQKDPFS